MKTAKAEFLKVDKSLIWLKPAFAELTRVVAEYVSWEEEPPYWNNENASVSMLVAAGARAGYIALSDYRTDKTQRRKRVNGRCDLLLGREKHWLEVEAKPIYIRPNQKHQKITAALGRAIEAARCLYPRDPKHQAALVFATMSIPQKQRATWDVDIFRDKFKEASASSDFCWMWYDSKPDEETYGWTDGYLHPGLAIFVKRV